MSRWLYGPRFYKVFLKALLLPDPLFTQMILPCSVLCLVAQSCPTLCDPHGLQPTRLLCPWNSPGKSTGLGCHFLLQGTEPGSSVLTADLYHLSHQGSPLIICENYKLTFTFIILAYNLTIKDDSICLIMLKLLYTQSG